MTSGEKPYICYRGQRYRDTRRRLENTYGEGDSILMADAEQREPVVDAEQMADEDEKRFADMLLKIMQNLSRQIEKGDEKLKPHFYGLYRVIHRIGQVAYELELPQGRKIHNIFHVSSLKKALGKQVTVMDKLPPMDDEGHLVLQPDAIIDSRERRLQSKMVWEFLVRWKNLPDEDATWESEENLQHPSLQLLEDKQHFAKGDCNIPN
eukprot:PITA_33316